MQSRYPIYIEFNNTYFEDADRELKIGFKILDIHPADSLSHPTLSDFGLKFVLYRSI